MELAQGSLATCIQPEADGSPVSSLCVFMQIRSAAFVGEDAV